MSEKFVLTYFKGNGRAVLARAMLTYAKADWENKFMDFATDWPAMKKSGMCEYEQLPVLTYKGKNYAQSMAINYFLARKFNLMGKDDEENYQIDNLMCVLEDIFSPIITWRHSKEPEKMEGLKSAALERYKFFLKKLEARYIANGKGKYFMGDHFTLCDIFIGAGLPAFCDTFGDCIVPKEAPILGELCKRIMEGELKEFHEKYFIKSK